MMNKFTYDYGIKMENNKAVKCHDNITRNVYVCNTLADVLTAISNLPYAIYEDDSDWIGFKRLFMHSDSACWTVNYDEDDREKDCIIFTHFDPQVYTKDEMDAIMFHELFHAIGVMEQCNEENFADEFSRTMGYPIERTIWKGLLKDAKIKISSKDSSETLNNIHISQEEYDSLMRVKAINERNYSHRNVFIDEYIKGIVIE